MRSASTFVIALMILGLWSPDPVWAEEASVGEASSIATNYLAYLDGRFESWGAETTPSVGLVEEFVEDGRLLGWVFQIEPEGFLLVSRHKELGAVKAWSAHDSFDVAAREGVALLLRERMLENIEAAERLSGVSVESMTAEAWSSIAAFDYRDAWSHPPAAPTKADPRSNGQAGMDYEEGEVLLSTDWHQHDPFNRLFPPVFGFDPVTGQIVQCREHALVGCVATAGAQLMRYWAWPPAAADGTYVDRYWWTRMTDVVDASSPQETIDAVAGISYNLAIAVNMEFGCNASSSYTADMEDVYQNRRYHPGVEALDRYFAGLPFYTPEQWFGLMKDQYNQNRPVHYKIDRHSIIGDGWYEVEVGTTTERWYHFNYGWTDGTDDTWYLLDVIPLGDPTIEYMLWNIRPDLAMGPSISGFYPTEWLSANHFDRPSRYFDRDVTGTNAEFEAGQGLQYVRPGFWVRNTGLSASDEIVFHGAPAAVTEFYHEAPYGDVKVRISGGSVVIRGGGEMAVY